MAPGYGTDSITLTELPDMAAAPAPCTGANQRTMSHKNSVAPDSWKLINGMEQLAIIHRRSRRNRTGTLQAQVLLRLAQVAEIDVLLWCRHRTLDDAVLHLDFDIDLQAAER